MSESGRGTSGNWWKTPLLDLLEKVRQREDQVFLVLTLVIGALTGLAVVAFILLTERLGMRLYPPGAAPWRRLLFPVVGSLGIGYLLFRYFPNARGSGVPQTKAALYAREGRILLVGMGALFAGIVRAPMTSVLMIFLPVVSRADVHKLEGVVTLRDVLDSYGVSEGVAPRH